MKGGRYFHAIIISLEVVSIPLNCRVSRPAIAFTHLCMMKRKVPDLTLSRLSL